MSQNAAKLNMTSRVMKMTNATQSCNDADDDDDDACCPDSQQFYNQMSFRVEFFLPILFNWLPQRLLI